jgi:imidazolonepropionase
MSQVIISVQGLETRLERYMLLIHSAAQVCTIPAHDGGPQRGGALGDLGLIENGAVAIEDRRIVALGPSDELRATYPADEEIDASGRVVVPGLIDPHTHLVWAGDRAAEFEQRVAGATYMQIMQAGGGINATVRRTRAAGLDELVAGTLSRLDRMLALGTTTVEAKTGYGLDTATELKLLEALYRADRQHPVDVVPTFLGAHAIPPEFEGRTDDYVNLVVEEMTPAVADFARGQARAMPFIDVFCEAGVFDLAQSRRVLEAGARCDMPLKIHADEFETLGGVGLAVELGAVSVEHVVTTSQADIEALGASQTIAVSLPATPFGLGQHAYTPARAILQAGGALAIATDCNPGTAWCESIQFIMALACRYLKLTPAQALAAATINAAAAIGQAGEIGSLEPGKQADVLVIDAPDYRHLGYRFGGNLVGVVVKAGRVVHSSS